VSLASDLLARAADLSPAWASRRLDSWANAITGLGGMRDKSRGARAIGFHPLTLWELDALYHGDDLPAKIVDSLPEEAMRLGWETGAPELDKALGRWQAPQSFLDAWIWGRLYGRGAVLIGTTDRLGAMDEPLDVSQIREGDLVFLYVLDGQDLTIADRFTDKGNRNFGDPRTYYVNATTGTGTDGAHLNLGRKVHASRLILFGGARTSERQRLRNQGRDYSVLQRAQDVLRDTDQSWRSIMNMIHDLSQAVLSIEGLIELVADGKSSVILDRLQIVEQARSIARAVVIDAKSEKFEHTGAANVTGVAPLMLMVFQRLAAAANMPVTRLIGMSPGGLNATGESDIRIWYASAEQAQRDVTPQAYRLSYIVAKSEGIEWPGEIKWPSLWTMTEKERADLEKAQADADAVRIQSQVLGPDEVALIRFGGLDPAKVLDIAARERAIDPTGQVPDTGPEIAVGSIWTDTEDGHRLEVTATHAGKVYFLDLDGPNPQRQYSWREASFLERARQGAIGAPPAPALVPPPAPDPPAVP
jgi:phage-related protein (TIGR01555 family)